MRSFQSKTSKRRTIDNMTCSRGDKHVYEDDTSSPATDMLETKLLFSIIISNTYKGTRFVAFDLKNMFLTALMAKPEYMKVPFKYFPEDIRQQYELYDLIHNGYVYIKI